MYQIEPISQIDFDGIQELTLVFDDKEVLQAVVAKFEKEKFDNLFEGLKRKYNSIYKQISFVGDKLAVFEAINGVIKIEAIHLSSYTTLYFNTNEFESLLQTGIQTQQLLKKQKKESML